MNRSEQFKEVCEIVDTRKREQKKTLISLFPKWNNVHFYGIMYSLPMSVYSTMMSVFRHQLWSGGLLPQRALHN